METTNGQTTTNGVFRYAPEFKMGAINRVLAGESAAKVSKDLKVSPMTVNKWLKEFKVNPSNNIKTEVSKTEVEELRKQVKQLTGYVRKLERLLITDLINKSPTVSVLERVESLMDYEEQ